MHAFCEAIRACALMHAFAHTQSAWSCVSTCTLSGQVWNAPCIIWRNLWMDIA